MKEKCLIIFQYLNLFDLSAIFFYMYFISIWQNTASGMKSDSLREETAQWVSTDLSFCFNCFLPTMRFVNKLWEAYLISCSWSWQTQSFSHRLNLNARSEFLSLTKKLFTKLITKLKTLSNHLYMKTCSTSISLPLSESTIFELIAVISLSPKSLSTRNWLVSFRKCNLTFSTNIIC